MSNLSFTECGYRVSLVITFHLSYWNVLQASIVLDLFFKYAIKLNRKHLSSQQKLQAH